MTNTDLVKRLREHMVWPHQAIGTHVGPAHDPLALQAADAIEALEARLATIEAAKVEKDPADAPSYYNDHEARGWASGYNAAIRALAPLDTERDRLRDALWRFINACDRAPPTQLMAELGIACDKARAALAAMGVGR